MRAAGFPLPKSRGSRLRRGRSGGAREPARPRPRAPPLGRRARRPGSGRPRSRRSPGPSRPNARRCRRRSGPCSPARARGGSWCRARRGSGRRPETSSPRGPSGRRRTSLRRRGGIARRRSRKAGRLRIAWAFDSRLRTVKIRFYGTKGYVEESSKAHTGHSAFVLEHEGFRLLCDFGAEPQGDAGEDPARRGLGLARPSGPRMGAVGRLRRAGLRLRGHARAAQGDAHPQPRPRLHGVGGRDRSLPTDAVPGHPFRALPVHGRADRRPRADGGVLGRHRRVRESRRRPSPAPTCTSATARL